MKKRTEWYDDNISDIEDDLPFLPESMKKQKALEEENNDQNNQKKSEELACAEHDEQDYPPDMGKQILLLKMPWKLTVLLCRMMI